MTKSLNDNNPRATLTFLWDSAWEAFKEMRFLYNLNCIQLQSFKYLVIDRLLS